MVLHSQRERTIKERGMQSKGHRTPKKGKNPENSFLVFKLHWKVALFSKPMLAGLILAGINLLCLIRAKRPHTLKGAGGGGG
jgi:hypothetical protein